MVTCGWSVWCLLGDRLGWVVLLPAVIVVGYLLTLAYEFAAMLSTFQPADVLRPRLGDVLRAWFAEAAIAPLVFLWWQPWRSRSVADRLTMRPVGRRGFVFVHGFFCNRGIWTRWLRRSDRDFVALDLEPVFGSIDEYAGSIDDAVNRVRRSTGMAPVVVAHSMGGLAVRAWLASSGRVSEVHRVVTIATPHGGTRAASLHARARNLAQMAVGSAWLADLTAREDLATRSRFVCFWGHCDNIVFPVRSARLEGADNRHIAATPHVKMVFHPHIYAAVIALADEPSEASR